MEKRKKKKKIIEGIKYLLQDLKKRKMTSVLIYYLLDLEYI